MPAVTRFVITAALVAGVVAPASAQVLPAELTALAATAKIDRPIGAWCRGRFRVGATDAFVVAVPADTTGGRYLVLGVDAGVVELATYSGGADLTCHTRANAESLSEALVRSETVQGTIAPRFDTTVICAFVENTAATCWQYSPVDRAFIRVGGWTT